MYTIRKTITTMAVLTVLACGFGVQTAITSADTSGHGHTGGYCLVCDVADKINALPDKTEITVDNVAAVTQQIHDIDRIKYDLTDEQFEQLALLVDVGEYGYVTKYYQAIEGVQNINEGASFTITKSFDLGGEALQDTSQTQAAFSVTNVESLQTTTLTLFDLGVSTSELGFSYYEMTASGWAYTYTLPAGTYEIKELYTDKAVTINGREVYMVCSSMEVDGHKENGNGITVTLAQGEEKTVSVLNSLSESVYKVQDVNGNGIAGVTLNSNALFEVGESERTTGADGTFTAQTGLSWTDSLTVESLPDGYCKPDPIAYELTDDTYGGLEVAFVGSGYSFTLTLQTHRYTHGTCENCGDVTDGDIHEYVPVAETPATCTEGGVKAHYRCTGCDLYFDEHKQETAYENLKTSALGHEYGEWVETKPATATEKGERAQECSRCHDIKTEEIPVNDESKYEIMVIGGLGAIAILVALVTAWAVSKKE